jgi:hypothetical protein
MGSKLSATDRARLIRYGFDVTGESTINTLPRLTMAVSAPDKNGKSGFGLRVTPPVMYFNFDRKIEHTSLDALGVDQSNLIIKELYFNVKDAQDIHKKKWDEVEEAYLWALREADSVRSIVIDTETEMWALARLAAFGRVTKVLPYQYITVNAMYSEMIKQAERHDKNVIFLRRVKKEYKEGKDGVSNWTGEMEVSGFSQLQYLVQVNAAIRRETVWDEKREVDEQQFTLEIINNGLKAVMNGMEFSGAMCEFKWVASMLTDTSPTDWD